MRSPRCAFHGHRKATHRVWGRRRSGLVCDDCARRYHRAGRRVVELDPGPQLRLFDVA